MSEDIHGDREVLMEVTNTYEVVQGVYLCLRSVWPAGSRQAIPTTSVPAAAK